MNKPAPSEGLIKEAEETMKKLWIDSLVDLPNDPKEWCCLMYQDVPQHMPATYENGWWYWADTDADPIPAENISHWIFIKELLGSTR